MQAVTLTGVPTDVVLAGTTVQLTATPLSATGTALPTRAVTWQSSDPAIATVGATGAVSVVGAGSVTITASSEGKAASATLDARAGGQLGPLGGILRLLDGKITVTAPPNSFQFPTMLLFRPAVSAPPEPRSVPGTTFEMEPYVLSVSPPPVLTLAYDPARLPTGVAEAGLQLYHVVDGSWRVVFGSVADTERNTVRGAVFAGGTYAVAAAAPSTVAIDGVLVGGALYVGQTRPLTAAPLDARGDTLRGRTITWSTSDPSRATVDAAGNVTGHGAGTATITATVDGVQGAATVTVLARPAASWSGAEWTTLQGNPRHDGHVAATLDPTSFHELWVKQVPEFPRRVATGAGRVFVSSGLRSTRQITAFDAATGAVSWSRTFPSAEQISSPAFAAGRVYVLVTGPDAALWSLDAVDGTVRFTEPYADRHSVGPAPVVVAGGVFLGGSGSPGGGVHRFDALTGAESWQVPLPWMDGQTPAVADGLVLAYGIDGTHDGSGLTALNAADGTVEYTVPTSVQAGVRTPVLGGADNVLAANGVQLASIRLQSGDVAWSQPGSFGALPVVGGGVVYAARDNDVVAVRESDGSLLWTWTPKRGTPWGTPLLTDNLLFISTQLIAPGGATQYVTDAIDVSTGKQVWSYPAGGSLALGADGTLFIATNGTLTSAGTFSDGTLTAIAVK
ncbi:MAG TPA: PQQ-binding-like beta-propeller repeat protein [Longimicrobium sp.]|nr:PQQ-binding-like beta-propeller repeat protein [Longimicrobium sp.]